MKHNSDRILHYAIMTQCLFTLVRLYPFTNIAISFVSYWVACCNDSYFKYVMNELIVKLKHRSRVNCDVPRINFRY